MRRRQFCVAVFGGDRAKDLAAVFTVVALNDGDAIQQAWGYVADNWGDPPAGFEYHAMAAPVTGRREGRRGGS